MAAELLGSKVIAARRRVEAETPSRRATRQTVRELWDAASTLAAEPGQLDHAQGVLHREAVALVLREYPVTSSQQHRESIVEALRGELSPFKFAVLRDAHQTFLGELEQDVAAVNRAIQLRWGKLGALLLAAAAAVVAGIGVVGWIREPVDLAKGKPFTLSSKWQDCHPDKGECGGFPMKILFHTGEELNPWYQVDLGAPADFTWLTIRNRTDVAMARCLPLVAEVSDDGKTFREVARQTQTFVEWEPHFPKQHARYLRMRADRVTTLHLEAVRVHP
jgi:hypothetical protein